MDEKNNKQPDYLDEEERELVESVERGEWKSVDNLEQAKDEAQAVAESTIRNS